MSQSDKGGRRSLSVLDVPNNTKTWEYNDSTWSGLLTNYNGTPITYDEIGNPLTIGSKSLTWTGRQLQSITDGDTEIAYTYNGDGLRTSKTVNGTKTEYYYNGSILAGQKTGEDTLVFMYDNNSDIFGFIYNDTEYYYIKNAQNDVVAIADARGNVLVKYFYDAWGKINQIISKSGKDITYSEEYVQEAKYDPDTGEWKTVCDEFGEPIKFATESSTLARINPILYRSYYYDKETEWYYLNTRYYSPDMCRFINADGIIQTGQGMLDKNMFAYCLNNPVNYKDANGNAPSMSRKDVEDYIFISVLIEAIVAAQSHKSPTPASVSICKDDKTHVPPGVAKITDKRKKGAKKDNNFEVVDSYLITSKIQQIQICQAIIDYNNENPEDYEWNRDIVTMIVEWDWHNDFAPYIENGRSVNFDMGKGTDSTDKSEQMWGWACEKIKSYF